CSEQEQGQEQASRSRSVSVSGLASTATAASIDMGRWLKPDVYPLIAAMTFVTGLCTFQLTRNVFMNPDVRVNKNNRKSAVLENAEEGEKYHQHAFRRFLATQRPEVFPALNRFFAGPATVARSDRHD
ncbi:Os07g0604600, partial [Oryza sativa Japonica Group]